MRGTAANVVSQGPRVVLAGTGCLDLDATCRPRRVFGLPVDDGA